MRVGGVIVGTALPELHFSRVRARVFSNFKGRPRFARALGRADSKISILFALTLTERPSAASGCPLRYGLGIHREYLFLAQLPDSAAMAHYSLHEMRQPP